MYKKIEIKSLFLKIKNLITQDSIEINLKEQFKEPLKTFSFK